MAVVLNESKLGRRLGSKAFLGIQKKSRINYDVARGGGWRNQGTRCQLKIGGIVHAIDINNRSTFAIHPVGVIVLVVVAQSITPLRHPDHTCHQIVKGKFCIRGSLLSFLRHSLNLLDQKALIGCRNLGSFPFCQLDVVGLNLGIGKPVCECCVYGGSIQLRRSQKEVHRIVDGITLDSNLSSVSFGILEI